MGVEGVTGLPALVMFKHGLPVVYPGQLTVHSLDQMFSWVNQESGRHDKVIITGSTDMFQDFVN